MMLSNHLILCHPLLLLPSIFPSIRVFSNESTLCIGWPNYWSFNISMNPSNEYLGFISFRIDWFDLLAVQGTLKSLLQHHSSKHQFFGVQLSLWSNSHIRTWLLEKAQLWLGSLKTACESAAISNWKLNCKNKCCHKYNCFHLLITKCLIPVLGI